MPVLELPLAARWEEDSDLLFEDESPVVQASVESNVNQ